MLRLALIYVLLVITTTLQGQSDLAIGTWRDFLPYQQGTSVTQSDEKIIYSTPLSVFSIDKSDGSVNFLSKVNGLSDIGIEKVRWDPFNNQLFIIYTNSNIDIVNGDDVTNISNIESNTTIIGNKTVNDIFFLNDRSSFFATDFGIVAFDNQDYNFGATILTGVGINQITVKDDIIYAASQEGVYYIDTQLENNIADFSQWLFLGTEEGLPPLYKSTSIVNHKNLIYIGVESAVYKSADSAFSWSEIHDERGLDLQFLQATQDRLIAGWRGPNFSNQILFFDEDDNSLRRGGSCAGIPVEAILDESGRVWYADLFSKIRMAESYQATCTFTSYDAPFSENVSDIVLKDGSALIASGGVAENFTFLFAREGFYLQNDGSWQNFNEIDNAQIAALDLLNVYRVAYHPSLPKIYAGSYWAGLLEYDQEADNYTLYNKTNSSLRGTIGDPARERVSGLAFDEEENLWVSTYDAPEPLNILRADGQWQSISVPGTGAITDLEIDLDGYLWMPVDGNNAGVLVYDPGPSAQSIADDQTRLITSTESELTTNTVLSVVIDLDGAVWVGTNEGPVIFDCGGDVFDVSRCAGVRRRVLQDSIGAFLLADQQINTMAVDGANRKWLGTRNGLFVQSPQGDDQIAHFTTDNSPIPDDVINALAFDGEQGVMWIGTDKGVITYRTETTEGAVFHRSNEVYAYPNPVEPSYSGPIAIKGLVTDANVKITDINGLLVSEMTALGGQAIWDGNDLEGRRVNSGVYLVFSADQRAFDRPDSFVTKIMVLR